MVSELKGADVLKQGGGHGLSVFGGGGGAVDVVGEEIDYNEKEHTIAVGRRDGQRVDANDVVGRGNLVVED